MNVYIWNRIEHATDSYHSEGGLVVFAVNLERARVIANEVEGVELNIDEAPNDVREVCEGEEAVYVMPDAGCC